MEAGPPPLHQMCQLHHPLLTADVHCTMGPIELGNWQTTDSLKLWFLIVHRTNMQCNYTFLWGWYFSLRKNYLLCDNISFTHQTAEMIFLFQYLSGQFTISLHEYSVLLILMDSISCKRLSSTLNTSDPLTFGTAASTRQLPTTTSKIQHYFLFI